MHSYIARTDEAVAMPSLGKMTCYTLAFLWSNKTIPYIEFHMVYCHTIDAVICKLICKMKTKKKSSHLKCKFFFHLANGFVTISTLHKNITIKLFNVLRLIDFFSLI